MAGAYVKKLGGLGYVGFAEEYRAHEKLTGIKFDYSAACVVTGSTQAERSYASRPTIAHTALSVLMVQAQWNSRVCPIALV